MEPNCYLPKQECQFIHCVKDDLETYQKKGTRKCVLLFPPLPSRLRYLIHSHIEDLPDFTTFSVGEAFCRRTVICRSELRADTEKDIDLESSDISREAPLGESESEAKPKSESPPRSRGPKRPDKPLYTPRAARERRCLEAGPCRSGHIGPSSDSCSCPESTESTKSSSPCRQECAADGPALCPPAPTLNETGPRTISRTASSFADMTLETDETDETDERDAASASYSDVTEEIKAHLKEPLPVSIEHVHNDYSIYTDLLTNISAEDFPHVIEIYDFPHVFKTEDLLDAFAEYSDGGMKISWVDNTHALGVFSSQSAAIDALSVCHPTLKVRPLVRGSKKAKAKAIRSAEFLQPVKQRPRTDCAVAQRMVARALGLHGRSRVQRY
ncbi:R3H and coiled-coil domain-containing protein 1 [Brachionichthys hirsutus]|uniref:R3H and coiled-coil domain-containing protein 1 n=1 Tax=Brachionichthys hirsutus TaxID=412623 RepID=UPI0036047700